MLWQVRGDIGSFNRPSTFASNDEMDDFFELSTGKTVERFANELECFTSAGMVCTYAN